MSTIGIYRTSHPTLEFFAESFDDQIIPRCLKLAKLFYVNSLHLGKRIKGAEMADRLETLATMFAAQLHQNVGDQLLAVHFVGEQVESSLQ